MGKYRDRHEVVKDMENESLSYFLQNYTCAETMPDAELEQAFTDALNALNRFEALARGAPVKLRVLHMGAYVFMAKMAEHPEWSLEQHQAAMNKEYDVDKVIISLGDGPPTVMTVAQGEALLKDAEARRKK